MKTWISVSAAIKRWDGLRRAWFVEWKITLVVIRTAWCSERVYKCGRGEENRLKLLLCVSLMSFGFSHGRVRLVTTQVGLLGEAIDGNYQQQF